MYVYTCWSKNILEWTLVAACAEIDQFYPGFTPGFEHKILGFDITMHYIHLLQKIQRIKHLYRKYAHKGLRKPFKLIGMQKFIQIRIQQLKPNTLPL